MWQASGGLTALNRRKRATNDGCDASGGIRGCIQYGTGHIADAKEEIDAGEYSEYYRFIRSWSGIPIPTGHSSVHTAVSELFGASAGSFAS